MNAEPHNRPFREYFWFAALLLATLAASAVQKNDVAALRGHSAILTVSSAPR
jgi:hypothetical protein